MSFIVIPYMVLLWDLYVLERERLIWQYRVARQNSPEMDLLRQQNYENRLNESWENEIALQEWQNAFETLLDNYFDEENEIWEEQELNWDI